MENEHNLQGWDNNQLYETRKEFLHAVQEFYLAQGYVVVIRDSRIDKYIVLGCDRGGTYRDRRKIPTEFRQRNTSSRLIDCPFEVQGKMQDGFWRLYKKNVVHNHEPASDLSGHPSCRRLTEEDMNDIDKMSRSGIAPKQIISSLREKNPNIQAVARTIYNAKAKLYRNSLSGRSPIQALFDELGQGGFKHNMQKDKEGHLTHLFFAHPTSINLSRSYSNVFVMDCTYKTNKYKMPLLEIIGVSSFNTSFYSCFVFIKKEGVDDYIWALQNFNRILGSACQPAVIVSDREIALMNAVKVVFPDCAHILCIWHINKNIVAKCKGHFVGDEDWESFMALWNAVVYSSDEEIFEGAWNCIELLYKEKEEVLNYIKGTWLPYKERFVSAWTEKYLHFGNRASSRAEGAHSKLKAYLRVSTSDLFQVKNKICLAIKNEFEEIKTQLLSERIRVPHSPNNKFFKELNGQVSIFAMRELFKQYDLMRFGKMKPVCGGSFMATMGLPCAHKMICYKDGVLPLTCIHPQWKIGNTSFDCHSSIADSESEFRGLLDEFQNQYVQWPIVEKENACERISQLLGASSSRKLVEPVVQVTRGRPSKKQKDMSSTRRELSMFEIVESTRHCSICKGVGHNSRTCTSKDQHTNIVHLTQANDEGNKEYAIDLNFTPDGIDNLF